MTDIKLPLESRIARLEANGFQYASAGDARALVERVRELEAALKMARVWLDIEGKYDLIGIDMALAKAEGIAVERAKEATHDDV